MKKFLNNSKYFWLLVALVYVFSRLATWGYPYDSDHWIFYYVGKIWAQGGTLYVAAWDHKPPLIFAFNGLMHLIFGGNIVWHRIWLSLLSLVDIALFWKLLKMISPGFFATLRMTREKSDLFAKVGLLLYVFWRNLSQFTSSGNNTENYGLIFFLGMLLCYLSFRKDQKWWKMLISGFCFSILFFLKGNFILLGVPIGVLLLVDNWKSVTKFFKYGVIFVTPLILQAGFWLYYFASKNALGDFMVASFQFSAKYSKSAWKGDVSNNIVLLLTLLIFLLPLLFFFAIYLRDLKNNLNNHDYLLVAMIFLSGLGLTIGVGSFYPYYFLIFMPISILIITYGLFSLENVHRNLRLLLYLTLIGSMILSLTISMKQLYNSFAGSVSAEAKEYREIADYVHTNTLLTDKVFAYDYGASFYQLSGRDSGSRFVSASVLLLENRDNYGFGFDNKFVEDMEKSQAKYVIVYSDRNTLYYQNKPLIDYFDQNYHLEKEFDKFVVLRRN
jgi:4-amino-4-deoxy-L-arabinose transferase-like glycosyltransferase